MTKNGTGRNSRTTTKKASDGLDESFVETPRRTSPRSDDGAYTGDSDAAERRRRQARAAAKKKQAQKRKLTLALVALFFLCAVGLLVWAITMLVGSCKGEETPGVSASTAPLSITTLDDNATLPNGTTVNGIDVSGNAVYYARSVINAAMESTLNGVSIRLEGDGIAQTLTRAQMGLTYDTDAALLAAVNEKKGSAQTVPVTADETTLRESLYTFNESIPNHAVNATVEITYDSDGAPTFVYTDGQNGMVFDYDAITASITAALSEGQYQAVIAPQVTVSEPDITVEYLKSITAPRASFTTDYKYRRTSSMTDEDGENAEARDINITKAAQIVNGTVLEPGEQFSFNNATGKRSEGNGWAYAKAVYDGSYRKETGGGVCQITTTMFNALLRGGLFDISHREHSIPSSYVGLGFDATVDYGTIDFKFRNDTEHNLYLFVYVTQSSTSKYWKIIHVELYGEALADGVEYRCSSVEDKHIVADSPEIIEDKKMPLGEEVITRNPHDKYVVTISVDKYVNGEFVENMFTYTTSKYELIQQQVRVGTSVAPTEVPADTPAPDPDPTPAE